MISTVSTMNNKKFNFKSPFWVNYFAKIKSLKKILIVMSILHLLGLPLLLISYIYNEVSNHYGMYGFVPLSICCLGSALLCGFIIAINSFDYLYKKSNVDMVYSLPLTSSQHFLSDYFAGLSVYTVPYILSVFCTFIINGLSMVFFTDYKTQAILDGITLVLLKLSICGLLLMVMFYTLTVLITCCCGSMFEAIAYNVIANGLIPGVIAVFFLVFFNDLYGIEVEDYLVDYISCSSPIGSLIGLFNIEAIYNSGISVSPLIRWYLLNLAFDVIYFFFAMFLYNRRKAEDVSKPFVFKTFYYVVMTSIMFIIVASAIQFDDMDSTIPMIVLSAVVYFIFEVIANRGFKKFGYSVARYFGTLICVIIFTVAVGATNGFGVENRVPMVSSIRSVSINYDGLYSVNNYRYYDGDEITFTDRDTIKLITEFHKDAIDNRFTNYYNAVSYTEDGEDYYYNDYYDYNQYISITYTTHLGRNISRCYKVSFEQFMMLKDLSINKDYIKQSIRDFEGNLLSNYDTSKYTSCYNNNLVPSVEKRNYYLNIYSKLNLNSKYYDNLTYTEILALTQAYKQDLENRTLDDIMQPEDTYCIIDGYTIFSSYTNTIDFLTTHEYLPPSIETELSAYNSYNDNEIILYSPDEITCMGGDYTTSINGFRSNGGKTLYSTDRQLLELLKVAQPYYITTDKCYVLWFNNSLYVVPSKYTNIAKECYGIDRQKLSSNYSSDIYSELVDIWNKYSELNTKYPDFTLFVTELMKGNLDITIVPDTTSDYAILKSYYNQYWDIYYNSNVQNNWNDQYMKQYPNYDDYVWYVIATYLDNNMEEYM